MWGTYTCNIIYFVSSIGFAFNNKNIVRSFNLNTYFFVHHCFTLINKYYINKYTKVSNSTKKCYAKVYNNKKKCVILKLITQKKCCGKVYYNTKKVLW